MKCLFKHRKTRYRGLAKNNAQLFTLFGLANLVLARRYLGTAHPKLRLQYEERRGIATQIAVCSLGSGRKMSEFEKFVAISTHFQFHQ